PGSGAGICSIKKRKEAWAKRQQPIKCYLSPGYTWFGARKEIGRRRGAKSVLGNRRSQPFRSTGQRGGTGAFLNGDFQGWRSRWECWWWQRGPGRGRHSQTERPRRGPGVKAGGSEPAEN